MHLINKLTEVMVRNWPLANGSGRMIDKIPPWLQVQPGEQRCRTADGFEMTVIGDQLIGRHQLLSGRFDRSIFRVLLDLALPGDSLVDVGANIGYASCLFLARVPHSTVIAVEQQPEILALLRTNLAQFDTARSIVHAIGLSDHDGEAWLRINQANRGASRIVTGIGAEPAEAAVCVPVLSGGRFLAQVERADLIKLDIEGLETQVITSAAVELDRLRPRAIVIEDQTLGTAEDPADAAIPRLLADIGYSCRAIVTTHTATRLVPLDSPLRRRTNDYVAVSRHSTPPPGAQRRLQVQ